MLQKEKSDGVPIGERIPVMKKVEIIVGDTTAMSRFAPERVAALVLERKKKTVVNAAADRPKVVAAGFAAAFQKEFAVAQ